MVYSFFKITCTPILDGMEIYFYTIYIQHSVLTHNDHQGAPYDLVSFYWDSSEVSSQDLSTL